MIKYSIVIPTYNHCDDLLKPCIESILAYSNMTNVELVVSANGCVDNTREYLDSLKQKFESLGFVDHLQVVWNDKPLGFSGAVNAGILASKGQRILLLNNDVILLGQPRNQWLDRLNAPFETNSRCGITSTLMLYSAQTGRDFAVFFCTMIDRRVIDTIGLLNTEYGLGAGEDTEYCFLAEQAGFEVVPVAQTRYEPSIGTNASDFPIWHKAEGTMHDEQLVPGWHEHFAKNTQLLIKKFTPRMQAGSTSELAQRWSHLRNSNTETQNMFDDIFVRNGYDLTPELMRNKEVIDVGANVGLFSIAAAGLGAHSVWSYEPVGSSYQQLWHNVRSLDLSTTIHTFQYAVLDKCTGTVDIGINQQNHGGNSLYLTNCETESVSCQSFVDIVQKTFSRNVIVKLDCEGAEFDIILQSPDWVFDRIKHIIVEIHTNIHPHYQSRDPIVNRLTALGYSRTSSKNIGTNWYDSTGKIIQWEPGHFYVEVWRK